jgi:N-carbamoyl-L-amino-acid hydrolase
VATNVLEINAARLWESLERSAEIGRFREVGLRRLALSAEDKEMRDLFVDWAKKAGCSIEIDRLGNIFARRAGSDPSLPPVAIGSHLDTQICGGRYDGILGVLCGL